MKAFIIKYYPFILIVVAILFSWALETHATQIWETISDGDHSGSVPVSDYYAHQYPAFEITTGVDITNPIINFYEGQWDTPGATSTQNIHVNIFTDSGGHASNTSLATSTTVSVSSYYQTYVSASTTFSYDLAPGTYWFVFFLEGDPSHYTGHVQVNCNSTADTDSLQVYQGGVFPPIAGYANPPDSCPGSSGTTTSKTMYGSIDSPVSPPSDMVSITYPASSTTPIANFDQWQLNYETATTTGSGTDTYRIYMDVGTNTSTVDYGGEQYVNGTSTLSSSTVSNFQFFNAGQTYYAKAELHYLPNSNNPDSYSLVATSSLVSFVINPSAPETYFATPTSTETIASSTIECSSGNVISNSLCSVMTYLFVPSQAALSQFSGIQTRVANKAPFGWFTLIKNSLANLQETASSTYTLPDLTALDDNLFTPLKTALSVLLWIIFGFWLFHRFRHFSL